jgi:hypothetical protein
MGVVLLMVEPLPSWPELLSPQQETTPSLAILHVCEAPAAMPECGKTGAVVTSQADVTLIERAIAQTDVWSRVMGHRGRLRLCK